MVIACLLAAVGSVAGAGAAQASTAPEGLDSAAASAHPGQPEAPKYDYYLALGDSLAWGYQPNAAGAGVQSGHGYADDLAAYLRSQNNRQLRYVNLSCPGENTGTMINGACPDLAGSGQTYTAQLAAAVAFLQAHPHARILVTLDIGANNVDGCLSASGISEACVEQGLAAAGSDLPTILGELEAAAGERVTIVGMNYYDPFLAEWLTGTTGQRLAQASVGLSTTFNGILDSVYAAYGVQVADVAGAFDTTDFADTASYGGMTVPLNVADICGWTWMCAPSPANGSSASTGGMLFNIHCNDVGYAVIAQTFEALLPARNGE
jgi:lysophospholipase L1-like esterase